MTSNEIGPDDLCPCDSGFRHADCCKGKEFKWMRDEDGHIARAIPVRGDLLKVIRNIESEFERIFERKPRPDDPMMLARYLYSDADMERETIDAMRRTNTPEQFIYAYKKTGLLIGEQTINVAPDKDIAEWDAAIDEYFELLKNPVEEHDFIKSTRSFVNEIDSCIIIFGYTLEHGKNLDATYSQCASKYLSPEEYIFICATRSFRTLRAINYLLDKEVGADALPLARSMYESYLHILFVKRYPDKLRDIVDAVLGLKLETHQYALSKNGKIDRRQIVDKETGEALEGHISAYRMVSASEIEIDIELFDYIYEFLSGHTHPSFDTAHELLGEEGELDPRLSGDPFDACMYALAFSCLILDEIRLLNAINENVARDIGTVIQRVRDKALRLLDKYLNPGRESHFLALLEDRLRVVGTRTRI